VNFVNAEWPRGLILLVGFAVVMVCIVRGAIAHNRNPDSAKPGRGPLYVAIAFAAFLVAVGLFAA
jgi:hypothetical protein